MFRSFAARKFLTLIAAGSLAMLVEYLLSLSNSLIAGNMLGEHALSAITLVAPVFSFIVFVGFMIAIGTMIIFSRQMGRQQRRIAERYFSQGLILVSAAGVALTMGLLVLYAATPNLFGVSEDVNRYVRDYQWYISFLPLPLLFNIYLYDIVMLEGGEQLCAMASVFHLAANALISTSLCWVMGIGGIGLGTVLSCILTAGILGRFFLTQRSKLCFRWFFSLRASLRVMRFSIVDASIYLFVAAMQLVMNMFLLQQFGHDAIIIFAIIVNVFSLLLAGFDGVGEAIMPLINVYRSEGGQKGIIHTMRIAKIFALVEGVCVALCLWIFAESIPRLFGVETASLVAQTADALRIFAVSPLPIALLLLYTSYYVYIENIALSLTITALFIMVLPLALGIPGGQMFGLDGVWYAFTASLFLALALSCVYVRWRYPEKTFPLLLNQHKLDSELFYNCSKTKEGVMELVYAVARDLEARHVDAKKILRITLIIEETGMCALESGLEKKAVIECTIRLGNTITVILRDSGSKPFVMDEDASIRSFSGYVFTRLLAAQKGKMHMLIGGKNRIVYTF